jgi:hypothetical protein
MFVVEGVPVACLLAPFMDIRRSLYFARPVVTLWLHKGKVAINLSKTKFNLKCNDPVRTAL